MIIVSACNIFWNNKNKLGLFTPFFVMLFKILLRQFNFLHLCYDHLNKKVYAVEMSEATEKEHSSN